MDIWNSWTSLLAQTMHLIAGQFGVHQAVAVIALTVLARLALLPLSLRTAQRAEVNKAKMKALKPELQAMKERLGDDRSALSAETMRLYRERGIQFLDRMTVANIATQGVFGIGMFQVLNQAAIASKFLWIANLAKPDFWLSALIVALMLAGMALMPGAMSDTTAWVTMGIVTVVIGLSMLAMPSMVGVYWAASNVVTLLQALLLRRMARRSPVAI